MSRAFVESVIYYGNTIRLKRDIYCSGFKTRYIAYRYICGKKRPNVFNSDEGYFHLANLDSLLSIVFPLPRWKEMIILKTYRVNVRLPLKRDRLLILLQHLGLAIRVFYCLSNIMSYNKFSRLIQLVYLLFCIIKIKEGYATN